MRKSLKKLAASAAAGVLAFTLALSLAPDTASAVECSKEGKKAGKAEINLDEPAYHAYFGFQQTGSWTFRNAWYDPSLGLTGTGYGDGMSYDNIITDGGNQLVEGATVTDAEITGNGTYTVGMSGLNGILPQDDGGDTKTSLIFVSTDIPYSAADTIKISDVKLLIDGTEATIPEEPYYNVDAQEWGLLEFDIVNTYQTQGYSSPSVLTPSDSVEIQFTVSGFNVDNPDATVSEPTEDPAAADTSSAVTSASSSSSVDDEASGGSSAGTIAIIVIIVVIVVVGAVIIFMRKKKK